MWINQTVVRDQFKASEQTYWKRVIFPFSGGLISCNSYSNVHRDMWTWHLNYSSSKFCKTSVQFSGKCPNSYVKGAIGSIPTVIFIYLYIWQQKRQHSLKQAIYFKRRRSVGENKITLSYIECVWVCMAAESAVRCAVAYCFHISACICVTDGLETESVCVCAWRFRCVFCEWVTEWKQNQRPGSERRAEWKHLEEREKPINHDCNAYHLTHTHACTHTNSAEHETKTQKCTEKLFLKIALVNNVVQNKSSYDFDQCIVDRIF